MPRVCTDPKTSLRRMMNAKGLTVKAMATKSGIPEGTLCGAISGRLRLAPDRVAKLAEILYCTPGELADVTGDGHHGRRAHAPAADNPWRKPFIAKKDQEKPEKPSKPVDENEKLWLYFRQLNRRVMDLEARLEELGA